MPQPIPMPVRQQIWSRHAEGQDATTIARALGLCPRTVQQLVQRLQKRGQDALQADYHAPQHPTTIPEPLVHEAVFLHHEHPTWGAGFIRVRLQLRHPTLTIPSERTLQRWFRQTHLPAAPPGRKPSRERDSARCPHAVWQMDASERIRLATGQSISWLRGVDEFTGAVLGTRVFPQGSWNQVPARETQKYLRQQFRRWGRPEAVRVDNGTPWGNWNDLPVALALWLMGLGIHVYWNDPGCPQQNGKVERSQGTGKRWAEPYRCADVVELQRHLDEVDHIQRESYPAVGGLSRLAGFPDLRHSGRAYTRAWEQAQWSFARVTNYVKEFVVPRRVRPSGSVSVYEQDYYVGVAYRAQTLLVQFDPTDCTWVICDASGRQLRRHKSREITRERIVKLQLELRHDR